MDKQVFHPSQEGTPQGSVISPLLANIALHGMEEALGVVRNPKGHVRNPRAVIRYADDFVVFCQSETDAQKVFQELSGWLEQRGLRLSEEKTRIVHVTQGFDFLGCHVRQYPSRRTRTGYKLLIKPSRKSVSALKEKIRWEWKHRVGVETSSIIATLNPIIRGWANYFRSQASTRTFQCLDYWMFHRQQQYAYRRHPKKAWYWRKQKYWGKLHPYRQDNWVFGNKDTGCFLLKFTWFPIQRHVMVKGRASPDDPDLKAYWQEREARKGKQLRPGLQILAKRQGNVCPVCQQSLFNGEELHKHHVILRREGGSDELANLQVLHLYCHQQIHAKQVYNAKSKTNETDFVAQ